jgi:hypothetical protein
MEIITIPLEGDLALQRQHGKYRNHQNGDASHERWNYKA